MTIYDPKFWRWQVEERLTVLKQEFNLMRADDPSREDLQKRIGMLENELKQMVHSLGISNSVHFTGFIDNQLLPSLISSSDIYVSTSLSDAGIAASTAEAMSCEIPVVVSDSAENDKWIDDKVNGFLFSTKNHVQLAKILINLIKDQTLRGKVGKEGRNVIVNKNDYKNEMKKMNDLYLKLL